ncbi:hypothetical protein SEPCBS119000_004851 [Sporothrix epigloea]|uniref:Uncharacterized protein n=1 Tax=Sporothrix epigloea TaxID=1892477 RepID=A0ABP0DYB0_9PEZI
MPSRKPNLVLTTPATDLSSVTAPMSAASKRTSSSVPSSAWREAIGLASAGLPSAGLSSAGLSFSSLPSAGLPSAGLPSAGLHSAGLLISPYSPMVAIRTQESLLKTPLSPAVAYMDFLKEIRPSAGLKTSTPEPTTIFAPSNPAKPSPLIPTTTAVADTKAASSTKVTESKYSFGSRSSSAALSSLGNASDSRTTNENHRHGRLRKSPKISRINTTVAANPCGDSSCPLSAPPSSRTTFLRLPTISNTNSPDRPPFSAKPASITSAFDWESALEARYAKFKSPKAQSFVRTPDSASQPSCKEGPPAALATHPLTPSAASSTKTVRVSRDVARNSMRHIREVVTHTVTYKSRLEPPCILAPPKGKKRKMGCDKSA